MMNTKVYFCDTYALIEIVGGNRNYKKYLNCILITSNMNLMEMYYAFLRDYNKSTADKYLRIYSYFSIQLPIHIIRDAMRFKLKYKKERLSYVDCMGYTFALEKGISFLTGDSKFKSKRNVEFVK